MPARALSRLRRALTLLGFEQDWYLIALGALVGTLTGLGAVGFNAALELTRDAVQHGPMWLILLAPVLGMGLTGVLVQRYAVEAKGHGVPHVMRALIRHDGVIPARVGLVKVIASILTVGSGGSAGTEGPIVQIGATAGSVFGQRLRVSREQMGVLVGCGAAAGISSIFNAPIAGVFFVLEILLRDFSIKTFSPIVVASVFSAVTTQAVLEENRAIFPIEEALHSSQFLPSELPSYLLLGAVCGLVAVGFSRLLHLGEDVYDRTRLHPLLKPITGAAMLAVIGAVFAGLCRLGGVAAATDTPPAVFGNGYDTIEALIHPASYATGSAGAVPLELWLLLTLVVFKAVATTLTLASGGSGGIFAPSLLLGAGTGAAVGVALESLHAIPAGSTPASYALVGMAAVVAGATHAPLTAMLMLFEMTRNVYVVLPIMLAAILATVVAQLVERDSIYTYKLRRAGIPLAFGRDVTLLRRIPVSSVEPTPLPPEPIYPSDPLSKLITLHAHYHVPDFPVVDEHGRYIGMVTGADMRTALIDREAIPLLLVAEIMRTDLPTVSSEERLDTVMDKFARHDIASLCLVAGKDGAKPVALVARSKLLKRYQEALEQG